MLASVNILFFRYSLVLKRKGREPCRNFSHHLCPRRNHPRFLYHNSAPCCFKAKASRLPVFLSAFERLWKHGWKTLSSTEPQPGKSQDAVLLEIDISSLYKPMRSSFVSTIKDLCTENQKKELFKGPVV